jgi:hypothetical protein
VIEPAEHVLVLWPDCVLGIDQIADTVPLVQPAVQPGPDYKPLFAARVGPALLLPSWEAGDRAMVHEVVPTADHETRHVHSVEVERAVFVLPIVVVVRIVEPLFEQFAIVIRLAAVGGQRQEPLPPSRAANAIVFVERTDVLCRPCTARSDSAAA